MGKDYYLILGVSRGESPRGIRQAFRRLARRHHPDVAGATSTRAFQDMVEAYRVLSDPEDRAAHDADLERAREEARRPATPPPFAEPLIPGGFRAPSRAPPRGMERPVLDLELVLDPLDALHGCALTLPTPARDAGDLVTLVLPAEMHDGTVYHLRLGNRHVRLLVRVMGGAGCPNW